MTKYAFAYEAPASGPLPFDLIGDWHPILRSYKSVVIHDANNSASDYNQHEYLVECDGRLAILHRAEHPFKGSPFAIVQPAHSFGDDAERWFANLYVE